MGRRRDELRCLIAAGGTAGHVLPALAVADALRRRGATVTFAGSPDRAEARLVPEAGYELDTFAISGLPRRRRAAAGGPDGGTVDTRLCPDPRAAPAARRSRRGRVRRRSSRLYSLAE